MEFVQNRSTIDYLHKLPVEIWREILFSMHLHPVISAAESITEPPESFHIGSHRVDRAVCIMQDARLKLLTLCKALYPLAEELLYSRVILYGNSLESGSFQKAAMGFLSGGRKRRRGEATNLLLIDTFGVKDLSLHLDLGSLCPRLHILYLFGDISTINAKIDAGWSLGLKMLTLHSFQFKWHDLRVLSVCFPRLDVLKLSNPDIDTELDPTVIEKAVFPRLEFLVITIQSFGDIPIHNLELPCLRWLSVSVDEVQTDTGATVDAFAVIEALLQTCKKTLIGVELDIGPLLDYPQLCIDTFEIVPNLETLVCYFTIYYNDIVPEDVYSSMTPHNLKHLVIYTDNCNLLQRYLVRFMALFTSLSYFPQLKEIAFVFSRCLPQCPTEQSCNVSCLYCPITLPQCGSEGEERPTVRAQIISLFIEGSEFLFRLL